MLPRISALTLATLLSAAAADAQALYFSNFESDAGGFTATADWQRGMPTGAVGTALGGYGGAEPIGGYSGANCFGTVLGGLHSVSTVSSLSQTFDFTGSTNTTLTFVEYIESGGNTFDTAEVMVNGTQEYLSSGNSSLDWRTVTLDLTAYDGQAAVTIDFLFSTTAVVERVGWYLDDVRINMDEPVNYGTGCSSGTIPSAGFRGGPIAGTDFTVTLADAPATSAGALIIGFARQSIDLGLIGFSGCTLLHTGNISASISTDANGAAALEIPLGAGVVGVPLLTQWFVLTPAQAQLLHSSDGLETTIQN